VSLGEDRIYVVIFPEDLRKMSSYLQIKPREFILSFCQKEFFLHQDKKVLYYVLKAEFGQCIFLKDGDCAVHAQKPIQCEMVPGRLFNFPGLWEYMPCVNSGDISYGDSPTEYEKILVKSLLDERYDDLL